MIISTNDEFATKGVTAPATGLRAGGVAIVVNGRIRQAEGATIDLEEIGRIAFPWVARPEGRALMVTYRNGPAERPEGFVSPGERVRVVEGEDFVVVVADRS